MLDINFEKDSNKKHVFYIRYMDDMVILANSKKKAFKVAVALVEHSSEDL
jgi:hypothetical protein